MANKSAKLHYLARFEGLVEIVTDNDCAKFLIASSDGCALQEAIEIHGVRYVPPPPNKMPWLHTQHAAYPTYEVVRRHVDSDTNAQLYNDILSQLRLVAKLPSESHYHMLTAWIMHTYLLEHEEYSPIICFDAVPERGKSRTGKFLAYCGYRGLRLASLREAYAIRMADSIGGILFFDLTDAYQTAQKERCEDLLLNRFERGSKVPRVNAPEKGVFEGIDYYEIFGPTIIATNEALSHVLESRGISIVMPQLSAHEAQMYDEAITPARYEDLRLRLIAFRARHLSNPLPQVEKPATGRLGDITRPLLRIIHAVAPSVEREFLQLLQQQQAGRELQQADSLEARVLRVFCDIGACRAEGSLINVKDTTRQINLDQPEGRKFNEGTIGRKLKSLGFMRGRGPGNCAAYEWDASAAEKMLAHYGLTEPPLSPAPPKSASNGHFPAGEMREPGDEDLTEAEKMELSRKYIEGNTDKLPF